MSSQLEIRYTPAYDTHQWLPEFIVDRTQPVISDMGMRLYPLVQKDTGELVRYVISNTSVLDSPMDKITQMRWAKKLGDGDIAKGMEKAKWVGDYAKYTGTMLHRSLERIIKLTPDDATRYDLLQRHSLGRLIPAGANIIGCELPLIGDGVATTLDLAFELDGEIVVAELKTLHRVSSDSQEEMLDCPQDRTLQGSKATKYRKQIAAQAHALEYTYGIRADRGITYLLNTVTFLPEIAFEMNRKMLDSRFEMFKNDRDKKLKAIEEMMELPPLDANHGKNSAKPSRHTELEVNGVTLVSDEGACDFELIPSDGDETAFWDDLI